MAATLARRMLRLLPRVGLGVVDVAPGTVVVTRGRGRFRIRKASPGVWLLTEPAVVRRHRQEQDKALSTYLLMTMVMEVLARYKANVVLDVGANKGQYAVSLRRAGYRGHIVSFEPVPEDFQELQRRSADDPKWSVHQLALGREDGTIEMNVVPGTLSSALPASDFGARRYGQLAESHVQTVPVRRLDGILDEVLSEIPDPRPYLKMDTQGFDLEVFTGLGRRARDVVAMQSEVAFLQIYQGMPRFGESLPTFEELGFEVAGMYVVTRERRTARLLEMDCVLVRPDALPQ